MGVSNLLRKACRLAEAAAAAYVTRPESIADLLRASTATAFSHLGTSGFTAKVGREVVVAFRGTVSGELLNWLTNLNFAQAPFPPGNAHRGMTEALELVWPQVREQVLSLLAPGQRVWFTGHSLGGALATLAAARFARSWDDVRACTFGSPRVGCPDFAAGYRPRLYRIERVDDVVCHLPPPPGLMQPLMLALNRVLPRPVTWLTPSEVRYLHIGDLLLIGADGSVKSGSATGEGLAAITQRLAPILATTFRPAALFEGHQLEGYVASLKAALLEKPHVEQPTSQALLPARSPADMPSSAHISINVSVVNRTGRKLLRLDAVKNWGIYSLSPPGAIEAGGSAQFLIESNGLMTGADGCVTYQIQGVDGAVKLVFQAPFWHGNHFEGSAPHGFAVDYSGQLGGKHPSVAFTIKPA
jgi:hypothetical protein